VDNLNQQITNMGSVSFKLSIDIKMPLKTTFKFYMQILLEILISIESLKHTDPKYVIFYLKIFTQTKLNCRKKVAHYKPMECYAQQKQTIPEKFHHYLTIKYKGTSLYIATW